MVGWRHRLNGNEFEQVLGDSERQESLVCCSRWGCNKLDMTEQLNWTDSWKKLTYKEFLTISLSNRDSSFGFLKHLIPKASVCVCAHIYIHEHVFFLTKILKFGIARVSSFLILKKLITSKLSIYSHVTFSIVLLKFVFS